MIACFAFLFCAIVPENVIQHSCAVIELNHVCSAQQKQDGTWHITRHLSQLIFWELRPDGKFHVQDWRLLADCKRPTFDHKRRQWVCRWLDRGLWGREVVAPAYHESFSIDDPELEDRKEWPINRRTTFGRGSR